MFRYNISLVWHAFVYTYMRFTPVNSSGFLKCISSVLEIISLSSLGKSTSSLISDLIESFSDKLGDSASSLSSEI